MEVVETEEPFLHWTGAEHDNELWIDFFSKSFIVRSLESDASPDRLIVFFYCCFLPGVISLKEDDLNFFFERFDLSEVSSRAFDHQSRINVLNKSSFLRVGEMDVQQFVFGSELLSKR